MDRTRTTTLVFALAAALVTVLTAWLADEGLRGAFEREFRARLDKVAGIAASQVSPADVVEIRRMGAESGGFLAVQAQLDMLCAVTGFRDLALVDTTRFTLYDVSRGELSVGERSPYDSLTARALAAAFAGRPTPAPPLRRGAAESRVAFAPVRDGARVVAVLAAEAEPTWAPELQRLRRRLTLIALVSVLAIAVLAGFLVRVTGRQLDLERRLTRSENLAAMGQMTATLAHEIKNPLAIIRGSAKRLGKLEPDAQRMADSVVEEVDRLTRTVTRYLQFARADRAPGTGGDLDAALAATLDLLDGEFRARQCVLEREGGGTPAPVALDPESLKQVCLNLVLNALEVLEGGGRVRAALARGEGRVRMTITDDGPGIPEDVRRRIGEPFFTTKAQGTGLGLFLARRLVESGGGTLAISCPAGGGTVVTVELPLAGS